MPRSVLTRVASKMEVFTPEEDERFIQLVSQFPILYDTKHVDFKELHLKDNIWKDISKELNKSDHIRLKRHWRNIRDGYARFKRCKSARTDNKHPRSKWQFYKLLTFLDGVAQERMDTSYTEELPRSNEGESEDTTYSVEAEFISLDSHQANNSPADATENNTKPCVHNFNEPLKDQRVSSQTTNFDTLLKYFKERDEKRHVSETNQSQNNNADSDVVSFAMHVKDVLNKLPPLLQIKAKRDIFEVLFKYELMGVQHAKTSQDNLASGTKNSSSKSDENAISFFSKATEGSAVID